MVHLVYPERIILIFFFNFENHFHSLLEGADRQISMAAVIYMFDIIVIK